MSCEAAPIGRDAVEERLISFGPRPVLESIDAVRHCNHVRRASDFGAGRAGRRNLAAGPMISEITSDASQLTEALATVGRRADLRNDLFEILRRAEAESEDSERFRETVRWPLVQALLRDAGSHRVALADGLIFEVGLDSRIEKALLLTSSAHPDHVWEPQTTKLLVALANGAAHVVVGGAYIGDHVLPLARATHASGVVHAFEPMEHAFDRLLRNIHINDIHNVRTHRRSLWDVSEVALSLDGALALASSTVAAEFGTGEVVRSLALSDYLGSLGIESVDLIMLDVEGGEEKALLGARDILALPPGLAPNVIFEIHRDFVDWTGGLGRTSIVQLLRGYGYEIFAIRDIHDNYDMSGQPIEIIPADSVYLDGPAHGFNLLAMKEASLVQELDLRVVAGVSPKLLPGRDPLRHQPTGGFR